jgi:Fe-S cluster biosynthesis and repair protein YggX
MYSTYARNLSGELLAWGANAFGGLNVGKYIDLPMPTTCTEVEATHYELAAAGSDFLVALQYPGLLGDARARAVAKNAFSKWRKKATGRVASTNIGDLTSMMNEIAVDEGLGDEMKALGMSFGEILNALLRANEDAKTAHEAETGGAAAAAAAGAGAADAPPAPSVPTLSIGDVPSNRRSTRALIALSEAAPLS